MKNICQSDDHQFVGYSVVESWTERRLINCRRKHTSNLEVLHSGYNLAIKWAALRFMSKEFNTQHDLHKLIARKSVLQMLQNRTV